MTRDTRDYPTSKGFQTDSTEKGYDLLTGPTSDPSVNLKSWSLGVKKRCNREVYRTRRVSYHRPNVLRPSLYTVW